MKLEMERKLKGRRIAVLVADGFERVELSVPRRALQLAGAHVDIISLRHGRIRGVNLHEPAGKVWVTKTVEEAAPGDYDGLLVPGGFINPDLLRQSAVAREFVRAFNVANKPIASLCHGPWVLASAGLLDGRTMTSWPGVRDDLVNAGAIWMDQAVVRDGNLLTSRGPQDMTAFIHAITDLFAESEPMPRTGEQRGESDPQRDRPPQMVISAMKWLPRPSLRTAFCLLGFLFALGPRRRNRLFQASGRRGGLVGFGYRRGFLHGVTEMLQERRSPAAIRHWRLL